MFKKILKYGLGIIVLFGVIGAITGGGVVTPHVTAIPRR